MGTKTGFEHLKSVIAKMAKTTHDWPFPGPIISEVQIMKTSNPILKPTLLATAAALIAAPSQAAYHLWNIRELYTDTSGSLQFIELFDSFGGQQFFGGQQIRISNVGNTITHTFTIPNSFSPDSFNHALLFGTAGLHAAGGPTPDFIIPNGFLFQAGGNFSYFALGGGAYTALPTDGVMSRTWGDGNAPNSPQNFAGQTGFVVVPEPTTWGLLGMGALGCWLMLRRRAA